MRQREGEGKAERADGGGGIEEWQRLLRFSIICMHVYLHVRTCTCIYVHVCDRLIMVCALDSISNVQSMFCNQNIHIAGKGNDKPFIQHWFY